MHGATSRRCDSRQSMPAMPIAVVMGAIVPSMVWPTMAPKIAPMPNCMTPISDDAVPAMCG